MNDQEMGDEMIPPKREGDESPNIAEQKKQQQEHEAAYQEQQRRRSCPGCGEEPFV